MRIAINTRLLLKNRLEGIGWFTFETLKRIVEQHPEHEYIFLFDRKPHPDFIFSKSIKPVVLKPQARHPFLWYIWFDYSVSSFLRKNKVDLFISPDGFIPTKCKVPTLNVIHDINFHHYPKGLPLLTRAFYRHFFPIYAKKSTHIVTVSHYSKNDLIESYGIEPSKISVVYNGANSRFAPINEEQQKLVRQKYTSGNPYFVFVGALNPRKNVDRLLRAFDQFKETTNNEHKLVIVGEPMFMTKSIEQTLKVMKHNSSVVFTGRLQVDELSKVVAGATALTFVPYFEGFGIPLVEAMHCHVPIIASNVTSMPEVAGDAAYYVNPFDVNQIAEAMELFVSSNELVKSLTYKAIERKTLFSWDKTASEFYKYIQNLIR
ncbi:MAG TPA: glycosyltransferase family 1 protein [Bacteroidetes bacterium]|nr:glycosyltransferase family 1 protein [Bacteroidota bacterium]